MNPAATSTPPAPPARPPIAPRQPIRVLGVPLDNITSAETVDCIFTELAHGRGGWVLTPNLDILRVLSRDPQYAALCSAANLRVADGMPLVWASRLQRTPLPERVAGSDLIWSVSARAAREGRSVFFLGGNPGAAEDAARRLTALNPDLRVAGTDCPPIGFEKDPGYMAQLQQRLAAAAPDVCYVGLGIGKQDRLIRQLLPLLPRTWFLGIGISFSYVSGEVKRAPRWMRLTGLEWAFRLIQEPKRLGKRYLVHGIPFAVRLLIASAIAGRRGSTAVPVADGGVR